VDPSARQFDGARRLEQLQRALHHLSHGSDHGGHETNLIGTPDQIRAFAREVIPAFPGRSRAGLAPRTVVAAS
jgi:hypothetical protein